MQISKHGIETVDSNIMTVKNFPLLETQKSVRGFPGLSGFYRKHIKNYSVIASPFYKLTKKCKGKFKLTKEAIESLEILKTQLITAPILTFPRLGEHDHAPLNLAIDSSKLGIGWV